MVGDVVRRPQALVGRHRDEQEPAGAAHAPQFAQGGPVIRRVLDHVEARDQVEVAVLPGQLLEPPDQHLAAPPIARDGSGSRVEFDAEDLAVAAELLERPA